MRTRSRIGLPALIAAALIGLVAPLSAQNLPTPYSAEQIRDAFQEGLEIVTRTWSPAGETHSRLTIAAADADGMTFVDQPEDAEGRPTGDSTTGSAPWTALRDHATFPEAGARRERYDHFFTLGHLEGWLYIVDTPDGGSSLFFFADRYPGPPVLYQSFKDGERTSHVEQIERQLAAPSPLEGLAESALEELPAEAVRRLEHAVGEWQVRADQYDAEGKVVATREWRNRAEWLLPGRLVLLTHETAHLGSVSKGLVFYSISEETWYIVDVNQNGERWVLSGGLEREVLTSEPKRMPDGRELVIRFTHEKVEADSFEALQEVSSDRGETWRTTGRQYLTRIR